MIFNLYKNRGETPLECIERFRRIKPELKKVSMTYLGRLDPLAEGVLLVGTGEHAEQKERENFFGLDKEYEFSAIFGFATDTFDVMGKITHPNPSLNVREGQDQNQSEFEMDLIKLCKIYEGERGQKYPKYSSKMIAHGFPSPEQGEGGVGLKTITIYNLQFKKLETISNKELFSRILLDISRVKGDFRQAEILELWKDRLLGDGLALSSEALTKLEVGFFSAHVSSGTYIRGIVNDLGVSLGIGATTLSIKRIRAGEYRIEDSVKF